MGVGSSGGPEFSRRKFIGLAAALVGGLVTGCGPRRGPSGRAAGATPTPAGPGVTSDLSPTPAAGAVQAFGPATSAEEAMARVIPVSGPLVRAGPRKPPPIRIVIPSISLDSKVVPVGTRTDAAGRLVWETAAFAVGHHRGTANPGEPGKVVLSGHISSPREGNVFHRLPEVQIGAAVILYTVETAYLYRVTEREVVLPTEVRVLNPTDREQVVLITCVPDGIYSHRLVVTAERV